MKKILVMAGLLVSVAACSQTIINTTHYNITGYAFRCCKYLKIGTCLIFISESDDVVSFGLSGCSREIDKGVSYSILMKKDLSFDETEMIISHELVHIHQMKSGKLVFNDDSITFKNRVYLNDIRSHATDLHEVQAINVGIILYQKYRNVLYDFKNGTED